MYLITFQKWVSSILKGEEIHTNGDGETSRDFCYIDNTTQINLLSAITDSDVATDQVYNVVLNDRTSLNQLNQMIEERLIQRAENLTKKELIYRVFVQEMCVINRPNISKSQHMIAYQPSHIIAKGFDEAMD